MNTSYRDEANAMVAELARIADGIEKLVGKSHIADVPLRQLAEHSAPTGFKATAGEDLKKGDVVALPEWVNGKEYKLAAALTEAVCQEFDKILTGETAIPFKKTPSVEEATRIASEKLREILHKYANRYYAHAEETEAKFAKAQGEIYQMRHERHTATMTAYKQVNALATLHFCSAELHDAAIDNFLSGLKKIIELNQPRSEEIV